jgi:hypothetical protein
LFSCNDFQHFPSTAHKRARVGKKFGMMRESRCIRGNYVSSRVHNPLLCDRKNLKGALRAHCSSDLSSCCATCASRNVTVVQQVGCDSSSEQSITLRCGSVPDGKSDYRSAQTFSLDRSMSRQPTGPYRDNASILMQLITSTLVQIRDLLSVVAPGPAHRIEEDYFAQRPVVVSCSAPTIPTQMRVVSIVLPQLI